MKQIIFFALLLISSIGFSQADTLKQGVVYVKFMVELR